MPVDETLIEVEGPWTHRTVHAGGVRFHVVEAGDGPAGAAAARVPAVLVDLAAPARGRCPRPDIAPSPSTCAATAPATSRRAATTCPRWPSDAAGLIRALGETGAIVVGHDWGGLLAWTMAASIPKTVRGWSPVSAPHPLRLALRAVHRSVRPAQGQPVRAGFSAAAACPSAG